MRTNLAEIPGYTEAVKRENDIRAAAFLAMPNRICGIIVKPMTLRHWIILDGIDSPFLYNRQRPPLDFEIAQFLWVISPRFNARISAHWDRLQRFFSRWFLIRVIVRWIIGNISARGRFTASVGKLPYGEAVAAIQKYVAETFQDTPPGDGDDGKSAQIGFAANVIYVISKRTMSDRETIMEMPLTEAFQYMKLDAMISAAARGENIDGWNPSDFVRLKYIRALRERQQAEAVSE